MTQRKDIDDVELVKMYNAGTPITEIMTHFNTGHTVMYRRLERCGVMPDRKASRTWTEREESQLVAARKEGCTGQDYTERIPTRSWGSIKCHIVKMRRTGMMP